MMGPALLVAPLVAGERARSVYLPAGGWYDFWTHERYEGGQAHDIEAPLERIPVFVKDGSILPIADPVEFIAPDTRFHVTPHVFGTPAESFIVFEDDGVTFDHENGAYNSVELRWDAKTGGRVERSGGYDGERYEIGPWKHIE